ncbi:MAG TPA: peptide MFS transporter [Gemmatimonadaceae bacterium]|jgi:POT family proton-dependent oligopeptide transporter|nr:peptide MFS transporter [Gemmatimonadaceae bacterium]
MATPQSVFEQPAAGTVTHDEPPPNLNPVIADKSFFGHPRGLSTLFFTEAWERFSFYGIRPLLVLFMTAALADGGFNFDRETASAIVGTYASCVYLSSLPGGWIADRWLGLQRSIFTGGILIALGHLSIGLSAFFARGAFFVGLVLIVLGTGLLKPNISAIVGDLYPEGGSRRDAGFSVFYMGINLGAFLAPIVTGFLGERVGWHWGFAAAGFGMLIGVIWFRMRAPSTLGSLGLVPSTTDVRERARVRNIVSAALAVLAVVIALAMLGVIRINAVWLAQQITLIICVLALLYFSYLFLFGGLDREDKKRVVLVLVLFVFSAIFWAAFEQAPTSLNLFAKDFTDRVVFGWEMPTSWMQAANSVFVIVLAPVFAGIWMMLGTRGRNPSSPAKFAVGLLAAGIGFLIMLFAANIVIRSGGKVRVSPMWLVASYFMQTIGELSLSPVGLSSMTKLAPKKFSGQMMGVWFMATSLGEIIAGLVGGHVDPNKLSEMPVLFRQTALFLIVAAVACGLLSIPIRRMIKNEG